MHVRVFPLEITAHQNGAAARVTRCIEICPGEQAHLVAQHLNAATRLARIPAGGIERARDADDALVAARQPDHAVDVGD